MAITAFSRLHTHKNDCFPPGADLAQPSPVHSGSSGQPLRRRPAQAPSGPCQAVLASTRALPLPVQAFLPMLGLSQQPPVPALRPGHMACGVAAASRTSGHGGVAAIPLATSPFSFPANCNTMRSVISATVMSSSYSICKTCCRFVDRKPLRCIGLCRHCSVLCQLCPF